MIENTPNTKFDRKSPAGHPVGRLLPSSLTLHLNDSTTGQKAEVEQYIAEQFLDAHGASIHEFMPRLISMYCGERRIAAVGVRPAAGMSVFLEHYLSNPVEQAIGQAVGSNVDRQDVAEIGNLVATQRGASQLLFLLLTAFLHQERFEWVVFTATPVVRKSLARLGFDLYALCQADPNLLSDEERSAWGSYYENRPVVVAGHVPTAMAVLGSRRRYACLLALFRDQLSSLSTSPNPVEESYGTPAFAA